MAWLAYSLMTVVAWGLYGIFLQSIGLSHYANRYTVFGDYYHGLRFILKPF